MSSKKRKSLHKRHRIVAAIKTAQKEKQDVPDKARMTSFLYKICKEILSNINIEDYTYKCKISDKCDQNLCPFNYACSTLYITGDKIKKKRLREMKEKAKKLLADYYIDKALSV